MKYAELVAIVAGILMGGAHSDQSQDPTSVPNYVKMARCIVDEAEKQSPKEVQAPVPPVAPA